MSQANRHRLTLLALILLALAVFLPGINWGLPSRAVDPYLFGDEPVWPGETIAALAGDRPAGEIGADVDVDPLVGRDEPIVVNATDELRAQIIRRYRLFSYQPDEMITLMSLAQIRQYRGDPRLYQYGGLWIYPVGVLLQVSSMFGLIDLRADQTYYLDHPEAFGRFYVVMRLYTVAWGLVGVWAVYWLARRFSGSLLAAAGASAIYILMPTVVNMAHEAKPHLPAAVIMLLAVMAACRYVETGRRRWWIWTGLACGAALGMVLSALLIFVVIPVMTLMRPQQWKQRIAIMLAAGVVGAATYMLTNPYVPINLLVNRAVIDSNLQNSAAMYEIGRFGEGFLRAVQLVTYGATLPLLAVGLVACAILIAAWMRHCNGAVCEGRGDVGWLLAAPSILILLQFVALAAGKPAEYARFALFPNIALAIAAAAGVAQAERRAAGRALILGLLCVLVAIRGIEYVAAFVRDARDPTTRLLAAEKLDALKRAGATELAVAAEPAPYSLPPVDLFHWRIVLMPIGADPALRSRDVSIQTVDVPPRDPGRAEVWSAPLMGGTPISWASKPHLVTHQAPSP